MHYLNCILITAHKIYRSKIFVRFYIMMIMDKSNLHLGFISGLFILPEQSVNFSLQHGQQFDFEPGIFLELAVVAPGWVR